MVIPTFAFLSDMYIWTILNTANASFLRFFSFTKVKGLLMDSACQERTSFKDIFFLKIPFFCILRLLTAKFSKSVNVPADSVECMLAETERVEPVLSDICDWDMGSWCLWGPSTKSLWMICIGAALPGRGGGG